MNLCLTSRALPLILLLALGACREQPVADAPPAAAATRTSAPLPAAPAPPSALTRVAASTVCMVNDQHMGREQIAVAVGDKTYFGCCAGCKDKLEKDPAARTGKDPVTGKPVDKATAVIARNAAGKALYFESEETFARYGL